MAERHFTEEELLAAARLEAEYRGHYGTLVDTMRYASHPNFMSWLRGKKAEAEAIAADYQLIIDAMQREWDERG